ncbi:MAG TPA: DUF2169 domain-containing protein [Polyangiaceae bacterium]|nr:DUF2169 domain-containing protein [Polyangiaceae bacterium]
MHVACLCSLPVGIVRWHAPQPTTTVIVKATFGLDGEGLQKVQQGLDGDDAGSIGTEEELERASDFAPRKPRADVLLVGHAHSAEPHEGWIAAVEVDGWSKRFVVVAETPSASVPLLSAFLRAEDGKPVRVGPRPMSVPGWPSRRVSNEFDFGRFNVAPGDQRLTKLTSRARISLTGLVGNGAKHVVELPGLYPSLYVVTSRERGAPAHPVPLSCDTLWIHTDMAVCTLTWRGELTQPSEQSFLVLDAAYGIPPGWSVMQARLGDAVWIKAVEDQETTAVEGVPSSGPTDTWGREPSTDEMLEKESDKTPHKQNLVLGSSLLGSNQEQPPRQRRATQTLKSVNLPSEPVLPFRKPLEGELPAALASRIEALSSTSPRETHALEEKASQEPALPFARSPNDPSETLDELTGPVISAALSNAALPFTPAARPMGPASEPTPVRYPPESETRAERPSSRARPPERYSSSVPPEPEPVQDRWDSGCMPLDLYAEIKVAILSGKRSLPEILDVHSIDEVRWREEERKRAEALSRAAKAGDGSAVLDLRRAMRAAMRRAEQR